MGAKRRPDNFANYTRAIIRLLSGRRIPMLSILITHWKTKSLGVVGVVGVVGVLRIPLRALARFVAIMCFFNSKIMTRFYKPYTAGTRHRSVSDFKKITASQPNKQLTGAFDRAKGRNHRGVMTSRHRGGGHKRLYRQIDFKRDLIDVPGVIQSIEYDPNRNARIVQIHYLNGSKKYILHSAEFKLGQTVIASPKAAILEGNCLPLARIPLGQEVHNVECCPAGGGKLVRAAGT